MIYNSYIESVNEYDINALLEEANDRFEYNTMAEATAIIVAEHEENWVRFMKGIGISELASVMEGEEVIYEGARLDAFFEKAKELFEKAKIRLIEITKRFIVNVERFISTNNAFVKHYGAKLDKMSSTPSDFKFKGYKFDNMGAPIPYLERMQAKTLKSISASNASNFTENRDRFSKDGAENDMIGSGEGSFGERLIKYYYAGEKEKVELSGIKPKEQVDILRETKDLKKKANTSLKAALKAIHKMIKDLKDAQSSHKKTVKDTDTEGLKDANAITNAYSIVLGYYKAYSVCVLQAHGTYMRALSTRNRQAKAICTKLVSGSLKTDSKEKRDKIGESGSINTEAFLGAVEFI